MTWLRPLFTEKHSIATCVVIVVLVITCGLILGRVKIRGVRLGVAGVLFSGIAFAHFGLTIDHVVLEFVRDFGLILFVYAIGLAVAPGFFNALKARGLQLNLLAGSVVLLGMLLTLAASWIIGIAPPIAVGIFSGSTTNTPSLAATGEALATTPIDPSRDRDALEQIDPGLAASFPPAAELSDEDIDRLKKERQKLPSLGYAATYPFGVLGTLLVMMFLRSWWKIDPLKEAEAASTEQRKENPTMERRNIRITNNNLVGRRIPEIPGIAHSSISVSRVLRADNLMVPNLEFTIAHGDVILAVGPRRELDDLQAVLGERAEVDLMELPTAVTFRWLSITRKRVVGKTVPELQLPVRFAVQVTRLRRAGIELAPSPERRLRIGDEILVVGDPKAIAAVAHEVGDSPESLDHPDLIPFFLGIGLGVILGAWPIHFGGVSAPVKMGLAAGPLLVALVLGRYQRVGPLVWYLPNPSSLLLRELGITLFLAAVGLKSGDRFVATLVSGDGLLWMACGALITMIPLLLVALVARKLLKINYLTSLGILAGSMTDPPALAFANAQAPSEAPAVAYAAVYPLTMILRVVGAQIMILLLMG